MGGTDVVRTVPNVALSVLRRVRGRRNVRRMVSFVGGYGKMGVWCRLCGCGSSVICWIVGKGWGGSFDAEGTCDWVTEEWWCVWIP